MKRTITLPKRIHVSDYHEFNSVRATLRAIHPDIYCKEVGFDGSYIGIIYAGKLTDKENAELVEKIKEETDYFYQGD